MQRTAKAAADFRRWPRIMKKRIWTYSGVAVLAVVAIAAVSRRSIVVRHHTWSCGRAYEHVLAPGATQEEKKHYRALTVHHADRLVDLGRWEKTRFRIAHMPQESERSAFMQKALSAFPRDTGYFQFWGAPGPSGPEAHMDVWCAREYTPEWRHFLVDNEVLIEAGGQQASGQISSESAPSAPPNESSP